MNLIKLSNILITIATALILTACDDGSSPVKTSTIILDSVNNSTPPLQSSKQKGQVIFYFYTERSSNDQEQVEVDSDFSYHVGKLLKVLDKNNIKHQIMYTPSFTITTTNGEKLRITRKQIPISVGYIMIKDNGKYLIIHGIGTDVDMWSNIYKYFEINGRSYLNYSLKNGTKKRIKE